MRKEAVYNAVGVAAYELHDYVDWDPWFRGALVQVWGSGGWLQGTLSLLCQMGCGARFIGGWALPPLPSPQEMVTDPTGHPASRPLRRRAMLLVAQWVARLRAEDRPTAYHALVQTLGEGDRCLQVREHWSSPGGTQGGGARQRNHNLHTCVTHIADPSYVHCLN